MLKEYLESIRITTKGLKETINSPMYMEYSFKIKGIKFIVEMHIVNTGDVNDSIEFAKNMVDPSDHYKVPKKMENSVLSVHFNAEESGRNVEVINKNVAQETLGKVIGSIKKYLNSAVDIPTSIGAIFIAAHVDKKKGISRRINIYDKIFENAKNQSSLGIEIKEKKEGSFVHHNGQKFKFITYILKEPVKLKLNK